MNNWKACLASLSLIAFAHPLPVHAACASPRDAAALKTAALQQRLMVAALTCHATDAYNRFVIAYRPELQRSDADLKAFFVKRSGEHGEADYDTYKTKLANLSAYGEATNRAGFCAGTAREFSDALHGRSLEDFAAQEPLAMKDVCIEPLLTAAAIRPVAAPVRVATAASKPMRVAAADVAVTGMSAHAMPAMPYGDAAPPPSRAEQRQDAAPRARVYESEDELPLPPRPMRAVRQEQEEDVYGPDEDYAPPPPRPYYAYDIRTRRPAPWRTRYGRWVERAPDYYGRD